MLTFLHLSDIHFSRRNDASQFDLDQQIRRALIDDLGVRPEGCPQYDALLITGDIAYSGKKDEYDVAKKFLEEVYAKTDLSMKETYVVPGNHDVDRDHVQPKFPLWDSHEAIRRNANPVHWRDAIQTQLQKDPSKLLLAPFHAYNDFAQGCECETTASDLAWSHLFEPALEFDFRVRLRGLNSALISDAADAPTKLLVSAFQTAKLCDTLGEVNLVMSHHPPEWLMDKAELRETLRRFAPIVLFGHEHSVRLQADDKQMQLFAGALQPERDAANWTPTYHIVQLAIEGTREQPQLLVRVHTRELHNFRFRGWRNEDDELVCERRFNVTPLDRDRANMATAPNAIASITLSPAATMPSAETQTRMRSTDGKRDLRVHFFQLPTPRRYEAAFTAGLLRDGDDSLDPQVMWAEVFRRADEEKKLEEFWEAVAAHTPVMKKNSNPFKEGCHA